ncbi:transglutaminase family protein [Luteimonas sp. RD2P54]|uniref:Transglutaminase family protein n=1 Tax=Luteimonas endophytica TaxID=3042023 RepID=A0ABT6J414_9GAMM|nr:transglutaminase family protein [Luteimonas endophytica]MDH5821559.1 transglutaminase family protein [Luteimonas endophytica]
MGIKIRHFWMTRAIGLCLLVVAPTSWAAANLAPLRTQFALPDQRVSYLDAKLAVDRVIDPSTDEIAVRRDIDRWERAVRDNFPIGASDRGILDALLKTLYTPGPWNDNRPFSYDLSDPLGSQPANKHLATYLRTRKGNCVSMPILLVILGQRLGLPVALATAPSHVMVKFADDTQQAWVNVEATQGGFKFDSSYERDTHITSLALQNDIYLRPLLPREGVGVIASTLMEHYGRQKSADALLEVAELVLAANSKDTIALIWKGNAYYLQLQEHYANRYPNPADIPADKVADYQRLSQANLAMYDQAERLGWAPWTPEQEAAYLRSIEREKTQRGQ